jgi:hypothetical protein
MILNARQMLVRIDVGKLATAFKEGGIAFLKDLQTTRTAGMTRSQMRFSVAPNRQDDRPFRVPPARRYAIDPASPIGAWKFATQSSDSPGESGFRAALEIVAYNSRMEATGSACMARCAGR